jgi:hypothetical protein
MKYILLFIAILYSIGSFSQTDSSKKLSFFGYLEGYYSKDLDKSSKGVRQPFFSNYGLNDRPDFNLVLAKLSYNAPQLRFNAGLMLGTYPRYGLVREPIVLNRAYELNVGVKLGIKKNIWLDAGIMRSHIGFENVLGKDQPNLTRSLLSETSPYYETGGRLSYTSANKKIYLAALVVNGWQRISAKGDSAAIGTGMQLTITPSSKLNITYSNYIGRGTATKKTRHYHNIYVILRPGRKWLLIAGAGIGFQDITGDSKKEEWFSPVFIVRYAIIKKIRLAVRAEYFDDKSGIMIPSATSAPFTTWGFSGNIDYQFLKDCMFRIEYRLLKSPNLVYNSDDGPVNNNRSIGLALIAWFN